MPADAPAHSTPVGDPAGIRIHARKFTQASTHARTHARTHVRKQGCGLPLWVAIAAAQLVTLALAARWDCKCSRTPKRIHRNAFQSHRSRFLVLCSFLLANERLDSAVLSGLWCPQYDPQFFFSVTASRTFPTSTECNRPPQNTSLLSQENYRPPSSNPPRDTEVRCSVHLKTYGSVFFVLCSLYFIVFCILVAFCVLVKNILKSILKLTLKLFVVVIEFQHQTCSSHSRAV